MRNIDIIVLILWRTAFIVSVVAIIIFLVKILPVFYCCRVYKTAIFLSAFHSDIIAILIGLPIMSFTFIVPEQVPETSPHRHLVTC